MGCDTRLEAIHYANSQLSLKHINHKMAREQPKIRLFCAETKSFLQTAFQARQPENRETLPFLSKMSRQLMQLGVLAIRLDGVG